MIEDIAQEVFAKAYFSLGTFTLGRSFEAWVAKDRCERLLRSPARAAPPYRAAVDARTQQDDEWSSCRCWKWRAIATPAPNASGRC